MPFLLLKEVESLLKEGLKQPRFRVPGKEEAYAPVQFFMGELPPKKADQLDFPYVILQAIGGEDEEGTSRVTVKILCGIYSAEGIEAGVNDILNLTARCRRILLEKRVCGDGRYSLVLPVKWSCGDPNAKYFQPQPYSEGEITTLWETVGAKQILTPEEEEHL